MEKNYILANDTYATISKKTGHIKIYQKSADTFYKVTDSTKANFTLRQHYNSSYTEKDNGRFYDLKIDDIVVNDIVFVKIFSDNINNSIVEYNKLLEVSKDFKFPHLVIYRFGKKDPCILIDHLKKFENEYNNNIDLYNKNNNEEFEPSI